MKRAQSEGTRASGGDHVERGINEMSASSAVPTSGYATMAESTEPDVLAHPGAENKPEEEEPEIDALMWINETYRRMTGDWTGGVTHKFTQDTAQRRTKSATGSPQTSGTVSLGQLTTELDSLLRTQEPVVQPIESNDDEAIARLFLFSDLSTANPAEANAQIATMPTQVAVSESLSNVPTASGDGSGGHIVSEGKIANLVQLMTSPVHAPLQETQTLQPILSTTQPDLISQADTAYAVCAQQNGERSLGIELGQPDTPLPGPGTLNPPSARTASSQMCQAFNVPLNLGTNGNVQAVLDDLDLRGPNTLFILPTVPPFGLDINAEKQQQSHTVELTASRQLSEATSAHPVAGAPGQYQGAGQAASQGHELEMTRIHPSYQHPFSMEHITTRSSASVLSAYSVPCALQSQMKLEAAPSDHPGSLSFSIHQTDTALADKMVGRTSYKQQMPVSGVTTVAYPVTSFTHNRGNADRPHELATSTRMDQWSSSGSDSATGVILRPDVIQSGANDQHSRRHKPGCPHSAPPTTNEQRLSPFRSTAYNSPMRLPSLPLDTLPARPSHQRIMLPHTCGHANALSRSIPCGVHLSGLDSSSSNNASRNVPDSTYGCGKHHAGHPAHRPNMLKKTPPEMISQTKRTRSRQQMAVTQAAQDTVLLDDLDTATGMLEDVPYVVLQRPKSVDVKQYQLHLRRQQQHAAALAAAGYPYHGESAFYAAQVPYHHGSRMPIAASGYPYAPYIAPYPSHHSHHHHVAGKEVMAPSHRSGRSERSLASKRQSSTSPYGRSGHPDQPRFIKQVPHDTTCTVFPDPCVHSMTDKYCEREKRKAKRRHPPQKENTSKGEEEQTRVRPVEISPGPSRLPDTTHHHHHHHSRGIRALGTVDSTTQVHVSKPLKAKNIPHPDQKLASERDGKASVSREEATDHTPSRIKSPKETHSSTKPRRSPSQPEDTREKDVPYPVSEIFFSPVGGTEKSVTRPAKIHLSTHHHPACASLLGRSRAHVPCDRQMPTKLASSESTLPSVSVNQTHTGRGNREAKQAPIGWSETTESLRATGGKNVIPSHNHRLTCTSKEASIKHRQDTQETIEKLREELRSVSFRTKERLGLQEQPASSPVGVGKGKPMDSTQLFSSAPLVDKNRVGEKGDEFPKRPPEEHLKEVLQRPLRVTETAVTQATSATSELDQLIGGPPRNPVYLETDTDSNENVYQDKPGTEQKQGKTNIDAASVKHVAPVGPVVDHEELPHESKAPNLSVGGASVDDDRTDRSPRSHSPSLPLSLIPSERQDVDGTDVSFSTQTSVRSSSVSYCSQCELDHSHGSSSPYTSHSYCRSHRRSCGHHSCHRRRHRACVSSHSVHRCHSCSAHCHSHRPSHRRKHHPHPYHWVTHHSERSDHHHYRKTLPEVGSHMLGRSLSDRRRRKHYTSSSERSESSCASKYSESSLSEELRSLYDSSSTRPKRIQSVIDKLLAQERKLRIELSRHRALAKELRQEKQKLMERGRQSGGTEDGVPHSTESSVDGKAIHSIKEPNHLKLLEPKVSGPTRRRAGKKSAGYIMEKKKPSLTVTRTRHYRFHPTVVGVESTKAKHAGSPKSDSVEARDDDLIIENAVAFTSLRQDGQDVCKKPSPEEAKHSPVTESKSPEMVAESTEVIVTAEAAICEEEEETSDTGLVLDSTEEIHKFMASSCISTPVWSAEHSNEVWCVAPQEAILQHVVTCESSAPHASPDRGSSSVGVDHEDTCDTRKAFMAPEEPTKSQLSSVNHLSELNQSAEASDGEYDGSHAINFLSEIIENALAIYATEHSDPSNTDGSTRGSSVCDEASVETVKAAHTPRMNSPSDSTTSASEGSEEIEPFPPPPPPELLSRVYPCEENSITHTHHIFSTGLDGVIEEESGTVELESDTGLTQMQEIVELEARLVEEQENQASELGVSYGELQTIEEHDTESEERVYRDSTAEVVMSQAPNESENGQLPSLVQEEKPEANEMHVLSIEDDQHSTHTLETSSDVNCVEVPTSNTGEQNASRGLNGPVEQDEINGEEAEPPETE
ncbi:unnamed protein product [Dicrocoelium dendriticum]|nr:unnamed protein product [Dicrocoelium dendriticum]